MMNDEKESKVGWEVVPHDRRQESADLVLCTAALVCNSY